MSSTCRTCLNCAGLLSAFALAACPPPTGTFFQREGKAFKARLHQEAKLSLPSLADDEMAIGVIEDARGKRNLTYVPFALHAQQGRQVSWVSWDGPFTLTLKRATDTQGWPFDGSERPLTSTPPSRGSTLQTLTMTVKRDAKPDWYNFRVTLKVPDAPGKPGEIIEDRYCPSIIVELVLPDDPTLDGGVPRLDLDAGVTEDGGVADAGS
jgi:hypothetical protein